MMKIPIRRWYYATIKRGFQLRYSTLFFLSLCIIYFISPISSSANLRDYVIGPQDVLKIEIWNTPDLSREVTISFTNTISFPLIGEINVEGLTVEELQHEIQARLADGYLVNPQVTITIREYNSQKVYVLGEVSRPGYYPSSKAATLVDIIALAGGLTPDAGQDAYILRSPGKIDSYKGKIDPHEGERCISGEKGDLPPEILHNLSTALEENPDALKKKSAALEKDSEVKAKLERRAITVSLNDFNQGVNLNFQLQNNDTIYIPKAKFFYVIGEVKSPGRFRLEKEMNIFQAISMASGLTDKANEKKIKIVRAAKGRSQEKKAEMTDPVLPDDVIKVPESFF
jgi:polysaccharide export outer membrane protein